MLSPVKLVPVAADSCEHLWSPTPTPPDSGYAWFRCQVCTAFGYRRRGHGVITAYQCTQMTGKAKEGCSEIAIYRIPGRGPRGAYMWRCAEHMPAAVATGFAA